MTTLRIDPTRLRAMLPAISLVAVLVPIFVLQPATFSYFVLGLLLSLAVPIVLATLAQLAIITVNDLDLSIGPFVSLVACIGATTAPLSTCASVPSPRFMARI